MPKIGDLTAKLLPLLPKGSETIGSQSPAERVPRSIGAPSGAPGSKTTLASMVPNLGRAMAADKPAETDRALEASLTQLIGSKPVPTYAHKMTSHGWDGEVIGYQVHMKTETHRLAAIKEMRQSLMPMMEHECFGLLGELKLLTKCRAEQTEDLDAQLALYARKILEYPADVVRHVLSTQADMETFWPSWAELKDRLEMHTRRRRRLLEAIEKSPVRSPKQAEAVVVMSSAPVVVAPGR